MDKLTKARAALVLDQPFFGSLLLRLKFKEELKETKTMAVDGKTIFYHPKFVESLSMDETKAVLVHEVLHCVCQHPARLGERVFKIANIAADYAINPMIIDSGFKLPDGHLFNPDYDGKTYEDIYSILYDKAKKEDGDQGGQGQGEGQEDGEKEGGDSSGGGGESDGDEENTKDRDGESPDQVQENYESCGEVRELPSNDGGVASEADRTEFENEWKVAAVQAAQQAKAFGNLPGGVEELVKDLLVPEIDWREVLKAFVDHSAKNDYSWFPPNRRHIHNGLYLPSCTNKEIGTIVIGLDVSGSIDRYALKRFVSEIAVIIQDSRAEVYVIACDTKVQEVYHFMDGEFPSELKVMSGGGTAFDPVFDWVQEQGIIPTCLIYFTDLCGPGIEGGAPDYPVLWAVWGTGWQISYYILERPKFGEFLYLPSPSK